jgi:hypothetical protein
MPAEILALASCHRGSSCSLIGHDANYWRDFRYPWPAATEDLPHPQNRVTVDRSGNLTLSYTPNNQVPQQKLYEKLKSMLSHLGMHAEHLIPRNILKIAISIAGCAHQAGICRFGTRIHAAAPHR